MSETNKARQDRQATQVQARFLDGGQVACTVQLCKGSAEQLVSGTSLKLSQVIQDEMELSR